MPLAAFEGECFLQVEVAPVHGHGDKVALRHALGHDEGFVTAVRFLQRGHARGFARGRDGRGGEVDSGVGLDPVDAHGHVGGGQALFREAVAGHDGDGHQAHRVARRDADGGFGRCHVLGGANQQVAGLVGGFCALVGTDADGHGCHVAYVGRVGIVEVKVGMCVFVLPIDRRVGSPRAVVGEPHVVNPVALGQQRVGRAAGLAVDHINSDAVAGLEGVVGGARVVNAFHDRIDADGNRIRRCGGWFGRNRLFFLAGRTCAQRERCEQQDGDFSRFLHGRIVFPLSDMQR